MDGGSRVKTNVTLAGYFDLDESNYANTTLVEWRFFYNDTVNNSAYTTLQSFYPYDSFAPDITSGPATNFTYAPEYNETARFSMTISEPADASGSPELWFR